MLSGHSRWFGYAIYVCTYSRGECTWELGVRAVCRSLAKADAKQRACTDCLTEPGERRVSAVALYSTAIFTRRGRA